MIPCVLQNYGNLCNFMYNFSKCPRRALVPPRPARRRAELWSKYINWELPHASRVLDHERGESLIMRGGESWSRAGPSVSVAWSRVMFIISSRALLFTLGVYIPSKGSKSQTCNQCLTMLGFEVEILQNFKNLCRHYCKQVFRPIVSYLKLRH